MSPTTRKIARLIGELSSIERRLKILLPEIKDIEFQSAGNTYLKTSTETKLALQQGSGNSEVWHK